MANKPSSIRLSVATLAQIEMLTKLGFGKLTQIIRIAIDRMFQQETKGQPK